MFFPPWNTIQTPAYRPLFCWRFQESHSDWVFENSWDELLQPPAQKGHQEWAATSRWLLSISKAADSTACLGSLFQCSVILTVLSYVQPEPPVFLSVPTAPFLGTGLCLLYTFQISVISAFPHMRESSAPYPSQWPFARPWSSSLFL